jgi:hypothetical protein
VPLSQLKIPDAYYPDDADNERVDPYGRTLWVDYDYAGEVSQHNVDRYPIIVDPKGHIIDGNHRAWAAAELLDRDSIQAWVAVPGVKENFTNDLNFDERDCAIFAIALHRLSGLPLMALIEYDDEMNSTVLIHSYVKLDNKWRVDASGETTVEWMLKKYPNNGNAEEVVIPEKDLIALGYGKGKCPTLKQVLPYAKEILQDISLNENFADGKNPGRKGLSRRVDIPKKATLGQLEKIAKSSTGERRRMAQWQLNMRRGRKKSQ